MPRKKRPLLTRKKVVFKRRIKTTHQTGDGQAVVASDSNSNVGSETQVGNKLFSAPRLLLLYHVVPYTTYFVYTVGRSVSVVAFWIDARCP